MWQELEDEHALHHARQRLRQRRSVESTANASIHALESKEGENQGRFGEASESVNDYAIWSHDHQLGPQTMWDHDNSSRGQSPNLGEVEWERVRQIVHRWMESGINDLISSVMQRNESPRAEWLGEPVADVDEHQINQVPRKAWDPLELSEGPITRGRTRKFKEALNRLVMDLQEMPTSKKSRIEELGKQVDQEECSKISCC